MVKMTCHDTISKSILKVFSKQKNIFTFTIHIVELNNVTANNVSAMKITIYWTFALRIPLLYSVSKLKLNLRLHKLKHCLTRLVNFEVIWPEYSEYLSTVNQEVLPVNICV